MALNKYILCGERDSVVLPAEAVRRLLRSGNSDAALCYLAVAAKMPELLSMPADRAEKTFAWLESMDLVTKNDSPVPPVVHQTAEQEAPRAEYTNADLLHALEGGEFRGLSTAVDNALGKKLTTPDQKLLLGLYDDLGLGADVIFLLVNYCIERSAALYGPGRKPTMRQIEREGYSWARMGLMDQDSASAYIRQMNSRREALPKMMRLLGLGDRRPSASEEKYLSAWIDMGFEDAVVELALDKTMLKCKELKWPYMNKILTTWHTKGLKTLKAVEEGDRPVPRPAPTGDGPGQEDMERMEKILRRMKEESNGKGGM